MWHRKFNKEGKQIEGCGGRVFVDRAFSSDSLIEIACLKCGVRHILDPDKNPLARWLVKQEKKFVNAGI